VFKVPQRRSLLWGRRCDATLAGLSLVGLLLSRARLRFTRHHQCKRMERRFL